MKWQQTAALGFLMGASFVLGQIVTRPALEAQGRGPVTPPPPADPAPPVPGTAAAPIVYPEGGGQSASTNGFLAVTGSYGVGTSVLYLVDTVNRQLAVYEARGGSAEQRRIVLVGARKLDLDLQLEGYNDRSEYDYRELRRVFEKRGSRDPDVSTGLEQGR
ncbi:MAG: hypothetical protein AB7O97_11310 [Planctomycetota bacterium]